MGEVTDASAFHRQLPCIILCVLGFLIMVGSLAATEIYSFGSRGIYLNVAGVTLIVVGLVWGRFRSTVGMRRARTRGERAPLDE